MAKQAGPFYFTGTIGDVIFYKQGENYYVRMKGSYNTKALQKPGARPLMQLKQSEFGKASTLASQVYRQLPRAKKKQELFREVTKEARKLLQQGKTHDEVIEILTQRYLQVQKVVKQEPGKVASQKQINAIAKQQPNSVQPTCKKRFSIAYIPQHRQTHHLPGFGKQVAVTYKNRKLKWPAKTAIQLE